MNATAKATVDVKEITAHADVAASLHFDHKSVGLPSFNCMHRDTWSELSTAGRIGGVDRVPT